MGLIQSNWQGEESLINGVTVCDIPKIVYNTFMADDPNIKFTAEVIRINTMMDGSLRFLFSVSEKDIPQAAMLMECKRQGILLDISATQHDIKEFPALNEARNEGLG